MTSARYGLRSLMVFVGCIAMLAAMVQRFGTEKAFQLVGVGILVSTPVWLTFGAILLESKVQFRRRSKRTASGDTFRP